MPTVPWSCCPSTAPQLQLLTALTGATLQLAKGFGKPSSSSSSSDDIDDSTFPLPLSRRRKRRSRVVSCKLCNGKGKKICQFCEGTTLMVGFFGNRVPCIPCEGAGTLGIPCKACKGNGVILS